MRRLQWSIPGGGLDTVVGRVGDILFARNANQKLVAIDIGRVPPTIKRAPITYPLWIDQLARKRWAIIHHYRSASTVRIPLHVSADPLKPGRDAAPRFAGRGVREVALVDGTVYVRDVDADPPRLLRWERDTFVEVAGVPPAKQDTYGKAITGDGSEVLIWGGDGYESRGPKLVKTFALAAASGSEWCAVPAGSAGFYFTSKGRVMVAERGKRPRPLHRQATRVMHIERGPGDSLLMVFGANPKHHQVGVWRDGELTAFANRAFGTQRDSILGAYWSERAHHVFLHAIDADLVAIPAEVLGFSPAKH